jgi:hypothetical protein
MKEKEEEKGIDKFSKVTLLEDVWQGVIYEPLWKHIISSPKIKRRKYKMNLNQKGASLASQFKNKISNEL